MCSKTHHRKANMWSSKWIVNVRCQHFCLDASSSQVSDTWKCKMKALHVQSIKVTRLLARCPALEQGAVQRTRPAARPRPQGTSQRNVTEQILQHWLPNFNEQQLKKLRHASVWDQAEAVPDSVRIAILTGQVACYTQITRRQEHYRQLVSRYGKRLCFSCASFGVGCSRKEDICHSQSFVPTVQSNPCRSRRRLKDLSQRNAFSKKMVKNAFLQKRKHILCNSTKMSLYFIHLYLHCTGIQKQSFRLNKNP